MTILHNRSVYGAVKTSYAVVTTRKMEDWRRFGAEALGLHMDTHGPGLTTFRVDARERRLIVRAGESEDYAGLGLEIAEPEALETIVARLSKRGVVVREVAGVEAEIRGVERFWSFVGPKRQIIEMVTKARETDAPLRMVASGFHTGDSGLFHVAITSKAPDQMIAFWQQVFDARTSDLIEEKISGINLLITFLRFNERHHSIAVARTKGVALDPIASRIQHMALEMTSIHDVIGAYERCRAMGFKIAMSLGKHTNDGEISFYVVSPSGFEIEMGWEPVRITEDTAWTDGEVKQRISAWGHKPEDHTLRDDIGQFAIGLRSLFQTEYRPF